MRIADYRDVCANVRRMAIHFHACVDASERELWATRARAALREWMQVECPPRSNENDKLNMNVALAELQKLISCVEAIRQVAQVPPRAVKTKLITTRAGAYNRSASRAVRISRAARSAMRRGYF